jgi:hypothetical protein
MTYCAHTGKIRHDTAMSAAKQSQHTNYGRPYRCEHCDSWHIGNKGVKLSKSDARYMRRKRQYAQQAKG